MLKNEDIKLMYNLLNNIDKDLLNEEENKLYKKLDILVRQINIMEESQEKMSLLQDEIVALDKGE